MCFLQLSLPLICLCLQLFYRALLVNAVKQLSAIYDEKKSEFWMIGGRVSKSLIALFFFKQIFFFLLQKTRNPVYN